MAALPPSSLRAIPEPQEPRDQPTSQYHCVAVTEATKGRQFILGMLSYVTIDVIEGRHDSRNVRDQICFGSEIKVTDVIEGKA